MFVATFIKDPQAVLDYSLDWADSGSNDGAESDPGWLQGNTIATSEWIVSGPDSALVNAGDSNSTTVSTVELTGGTLGRQYTVTNRIETTLGPPYIDDRSICIKVADR
jgi:hypothetical protein